jgi:hypothetical protein
MQINFFSSYKFLFIIFAIPNDCFVEFGCFNESSIHKNK